ncbi:hypothetical protein CASFOL_029027 [Castilleja foliolosa]|uniref:rRNA N-glycosylase n=1 Tax=Castilleja foliolosa TaxID=1961234 RepID=A0ABD3CEE6_9LAMI
MHTDLGMLQVGKQDLVQAYDSFERYIQTDGQEDKKFTNSIIRDSARALLTLIFLACEASRFESIKTAIMKKCHLDFSSLEGDDEIKWVETLVKGWSSAAKSLDDDIRLFQLKDWNTMFSKPELKEKLMDGSSYQVKASTGVMVPQGFNEDVTKPELKVPPGFKFNFRAIAQQLNGSDDAYSVVRRDLTKYPELYTDFAVVDDDSYVLYLEKMSRDSYWGDDITLKAAADAYNIRIVTMVWDETKRALSPNDKIPEGGIINRDIHLSFYRNHYNSINPIVE